METLLQPILHARLSRAIDEAHGSLAALTALSKAEAHAALEDRLHVALVGVDHLRKLARSVSPRASRTRTFLVADDSPDMRLLVTRLIRREAPGAKVIAVKDGADALAALRDAGDGNGIVVISDYDMGPGPTGTELLSEVAALHPKARRFLFTGHDPERIVAGPRPPEAILSKDRGLGALRELLLAL